MAADPKGVDRAISGFVRQCNKAAYEEDQIKAPIDGDHECYAVFLPAVAPFATNDRVNETYFREAFSGFKPQGSIHICPNAVKIRNFFKKRIYFFFSHAEDLQALTQKTNLRFRRQIFQNENIEAWDPAKLLNVINFFDHGGIFSQSAIALTANVRRILQKKVQVLIPGIEIAYVDRDDDVVVAEFSRDLSSEEFEKLRDFRIDECKLNVCGIKGCAHYRCRICGDGKCPGGNACHKAEQKTFTMHMKGGYTWYQKDLQKLGYLTVGANVSIGAPNNEKPFSQWITVQYPTGRDFLKAKNKLSSFSHTYCKRVKPYFPHQVQDLCHTCGNLTYSRFCQCDSSFVLVNMHDWFGVESSGMGDYARAAAGIRNVRSPQTAPVRDQKATSLADGAQSGHTLNKAALEKRKSVPPGLKAEKLDNDEMDVEMDIEKAEQTGVQVEKMEEDSKRLTPGLDGGEDTGTKSMSKQEIKSKKDLQRFCKQKGLKVVRNVFDGDRIRGVKKLLVNTERDRWEPVGRTGRYSELVMHDSSLSFAQISHTGRTVKSSGEMPPEIVDLTDDAIWSMFQAYKHNEL